MVGRRSSPPYTYYTRTTKEGGTVIIDWDNIKKNGWTPKHHDQKLRILSIDGGGIRGIFPARYLSKIESEIGQPIANYFDLIVGTSTGGIIALGLAAGIPAETILSLYKDNVRKIFKKTVLTSIRSCGGVLRHKYDVKYLEQMLQTTFGSTKIKDAQTMLCIPAVEHHNASPKVYKTPHHKSLHIDGEIFMWEAARATSAAPTIFPAYTMETEAKLDGGLWANNPVMVGISEALYNGCSVNNIKVLSLGTGVNPYTLSKKRAQNNSIFAYKAKLVDLVFNVQTASALNMGSYIIGDNLLRIDFHNNTCIQLDSSSDQDLQVMLTEADQEFANSFKSCGHNICQHFFA